VYHLRMSLKFKKLMTYVFFITICALSTEEDTGGMRLRSGT
jgi:hypothetical protein